VPTVTVNGCALFYEACGDERPGQPPLVLLHGALSTGAADWSGVAPLLAQRWRVLVPDCRGHGRSDNPQPSYHFGELAADTAALIRALGYPRAHVVGHSNGGNVALVTLLEHPEVVAAAVLQAANAYVSADLLEREPLLFDPERVEREAPDWKAELIRLHGGRPGPDYWRTLMTLTVRAIVSEPNYTPADLAAVRRPVLVIQGELDDVNAPGRHAQFLAEHIPGAELWLPAGVRHNVQLERPETWTRRVLDFLDRAAPAA